MTQHTPNGISIVIPAYNEEDSIAELILEIKQTMEKIDSPWEIILIDDGSTDKTLASMKATALSDDRISVYHFIRNQGKSHAYSIAFQKAKYSLIVTMDADLQDDPGELPKMIGFMGNEWDMVIGHKQGRMGNEAQKTIPSKFFNRLTSLFFGIRLHDFNSGFRIMKREVATSLELYAGRYRFIPALAHMNGFRVAEHPVHHRKRKYGTTKFGPSRFITGLLDIISIRIISLFRQRPFHLFGSISLFLFLTGSTLAGLTLYRKLCLHDPFKNHFAAIIAAATCVILAIHFASLGIIGELFLSVFKRKSVLNATEHNTPEKLKDEL